MADRGTGSEGVEREEAALTQMPIYRPGIERDAGLLDLS